MFKRKLSMLFFIIGSLVAIFSVAYPVLATEQTIIALLLMLFGSFVGYFNITEEQETKYIIAATAFIAASLCFKFLLLDYAMVLSALSPLVENIVYFIGSSVLVVSGKVILRLASDADFSEKSFQGEILVGKADNLFDRIWNTIVLIALALVIIILVLRQFFNVAEYEQMLRTMDFFIWIVFMADLFYLFSFSKDWKHFAKKSWLDIIAVLPEMILLLTSEQLDVLKIGKLARLARIATPLAKAEKLAKTSKMIHTPKAIKYFSKESGFNKLLDSEKK